MRPSHFRNATKALAFQIIIGISVIRANADSVTLALGPTNAGSFSATYVVPSNVLAQIVYANLPQYSHYSFDISVIFPFLTMPYMTTTASNLPIVTGPATIKLDAYYDGSPPPPSAGFCTIQTTSATSFTPSTAVVIPADSAGPVNIILESSSDLITWNAALPGTYGTSTTNRFFRVRAQRTQ